MKRGGGGGGEPPAKRATPAEQIAALEARLDAAAAARTALEATAECAICLRLVLEPVALACSHACCWECLARLPNKQCPTCARPLPPAAQWAVNTTLVAMLEANGGPGFRDLQPTLALHRALRSGSADAALAASAAPGVDMSRRLRMPSGACQPVLHFALEACRGPETGKWEKVVLLVLAGVADVDEGGGALDKIVGGDRCRLFCALLDKGAKVCTSLAAESCSNYVYVHPLARKSNTAIDDALIRVLKLLPAAALAKASDGHLRAALRNSLLCGHNKSAAMLLQAGIPCSDDLYIACPPM
jgi:hypothetical protein